MSPVLLHCDVFLPPPSTLAPWDYAVLHQTIQGLLYPSQRAIRGEISLHNLVDHVTMCVGHVTMCVDHVTMCVDHVTMCVSHVTILFSINPWSLFFISPRGNCWWVHLLRSQSVPLIPTVLGERCVCLQQHSSTILVPSFRCLHSDCRLCIDFCSASDECQGLGMRPGLGQPALAAGKGPGQG